ncbi:MAG: helix-turn-helix domain-containing protein [Oligoflexales bacterium]
MFNPDECIDGNKIEMWVNEAFKRAGSKEKLSKAIGVRYTTALSWFKGSTPNQESIEKLAKYLNQTSTGKSNDVKA